MNFDDIYTYNMTVEGSFSERLRVYELLSELPNVIGKEQDYYMYPEERAAESTYSKYTTADKTGVHGWDETEMEEMLHSIALQCPGAVITISGQNWDDKTYGFTKRFMGDFYQEKKLVTSMPPLIEGRDIPFDKRHEDPDRAYERRVHLLCEEYEGSDGIRSFTVLAIGEDKNALRKLMEAKVEKDEYGYIGEYGEAEYTPNHFESNYGDGFVEYYIFDEPIQTSEQLKELLNTKAYDNSFKYPENLKEILTSAINEFANKEGYGRVDSNVVSETMLYDPEFRAMVLKAYWGDLDIINDYCKDAAFSFCYNFLRTKVNNSPDFFEEIGAVPSFIPPDNLKDILIDSIYDVSRSLHFPVNTAEKQAESYMRNSNFRDAIRAHCNGVTTLLPHTPEYTAAASACYDFVDTNLRKENAELQGTKVTNLDTLIKQATARAGLSQHGNASQEPVQGR